MEFFQDVFLYLSVTALACLILGLFKPWMMVWWEDTQNRKKVIKLYGTTAVISFALYWLFVLI
jgi:hypothetical protein